MQGLARAADGRPGGCRPQPTHTLPGSSLGTTTSPQAIPHAHTRGGMLCSSRGQRNTCICEQRSLEKTSHGWRPPFSALRVASRAAPSHTEARISAVCSGAFPASGQRHANNSTPADSQAQFHNKPNLLSNTEGGRNAPSADRPRWSGAGRKSVCAAGVWLQPEPRCGQKHGDAQPSCCHQRGRWPGGLASLPLPPSVPLSLRSPWRGMAQLQGL